MTPVHQLAGAPGSAQSRASYAAYYAAIGSAETVDDHTVRHRLHRWVGAGTIEVTSLRSGLDIVRYDVQFAAGHELGYAFADGLFELEYCLEGRMRVLDRSVGAGELRAQSVSLSPRRPVAGIVAHDAGRPYRAVSVTGRWPRVEAHLDRLGADRRWLAGPDRIAPEWYVGRPSAALSAAARPLVELFAHRRHSPGRLPFLESQVAAALAAVVDGLAPAEVSSADPELTEHEVAALRRVPDLLWRRRHEPPTLAELARASSMSVRRLTSGFRALYGTSVTAQHRRRRLDHAAGLLVETDWTLARIAHESGYASAGNFGYAFRRDRGRSPARYRDDHRGADPRSTVAGPAIHTG